MTEPVVDRSALPQIDEKDIGKLLVFFGKAGYSFSAGETLPGIFTAHQKVDLFKADQMPEEVLGKPIVCTKQWEIIDGNHRRWAHEIRGTLTPYIRLNCTFVEALNLLNVFPFAYELNGLTPEGN